MPEAFIIEHSAVDPRHWTMRVVTKNMSYTSLMAIEETQHYERHPDNAHWTSVRTDATFQSKLKWGLRQTLETFSYAKFKENLAKSTQGIQFILEDLFKRNSR